MSPFGIKSVYWYANDTTCWHMCRYDYHDNMRHSSLSLDWNIGCRNDTNLCCSTANITYNPTCTVLKTMEGFIRQFSHYALWHCISCNSFSMLLFIIAFCFMTLYIMQFIFHVAIYNCIFLFMILIEMIRLSDSVYNESMGLNDMCILLCYNLLVLLFM
jgi:hypothetical protein